MIFIAVTLALGGLLATAAGAASSPEATGADETRDYVSLVDPFIGTQGGGGAFPGATMPFGLAQPSPNTTSPRGGGYQYTSSTITGFGLTHLSGPGCAAFGDAAFLPTSGSHGMTDPRNARQDFSHDDESASPGAYSVRLGDGTLAELTATDRTAWQRYTFPAEAPGNVLVNLGSSFGAGVHEASARIVDNDTIEGEVTASTFVWFTCGRSGGPTYTLHFIAEFERPFTTYGTWRGGTVSAGSRDASGGDSGVYVTFADTADPVTVKVGLSFTSLEDARTNLATEAAGLDFDTVRDIARDAWNDLLGKVHVEGGTAERLRTFYTALYHSLLSPTLVSDVDGSYVGFDREIHVDETYRHYTNFSMWDTYRTAHQVIDLVAPERAVEMAVSLIDASREGGWVPKWPVANRYTNEMIGDPGILVLADAWAKGLLPADRVDAAYAAMRRNAFEYPPASDIFEGRVGLDDYQRLGFVGLDPSASGRNDDLKYAPSVTLEYAIADCALGLMARDLGHHDDAAALLERARFYRNLIDPETGLVRPRFRDGSWLTPFDSTVRTGHKEGTSWQYTWLAPQDPSGLIEALGGDERVTEMLDSFFAYDALIASDDLAATIDREWGPGDRYLPNNEVDLQAPFTYLWTSEPWKSAAVVRAAQQLYTTEPLGIPGNDDLGALSSWHVLTALGLYPYTAGTSGYVVSPPVFDRVVVDLAKPYYDAEQLIIEAPGAREGIQYIESLRVNDRLSYRSFIDHDDIRRGLTLRFNLTDEPGGLWGTQPPWQPPSPCAAPRNDSNVDVALATSRPYIQPGDELVAMATVESTGSAPAREVQVELTAPAGWTIEALGPTTVPALPPGTTLTVPLLVGIPETQDLGTQGELRASVRWRSDPAPPRERDAIALVDVASAQLSDYFNNIGITSDSSPSGGNFGGCCNYSAEALAAAGLGRGAEVTVGSTTLTWPDVPPGTPDNVLTNGQIVLLPGGAGARELVVLGSATRGGGGNVEGPATLFYADGSRESVQIQLSDYILNGGDVPPWPSNEIVAEMPYRLSSSGRNNTHSYVFAQRIPLAADKDIEAIQLPSTTNRGDLHIFALGVG